MQEKPSIDFARNNLRSHELKVGEYPSMLVVCFTLIAEIYFCNFGIDVLTPSVFEILERNILQRKGDQEVQLREAMKTLWKSEGNVKKYTQL